MQQKPFTVGVLHLNVNYFKYVYQVFLSVLFGIQEEAAAPPFKVIGHTFANFSHTHTTVLHLQISTCIQSCFVKAVLYFVSCTDPKPAEMYIRIN